MAVIFNFIFCFPLFVINLLSFLLKTETIILEDSRMNFARLSESSRSLQSPLWTIFVQVFVCLLSSWKCSIFLGWNISFPSRKYFLCLICHILEYAGSCTVLLHYCWAVGLHCSDTSSFWTWLYSTHTWVYIFKVPCCFCARTGTESTSACFSWKAFDTFLSHRSCISKQIPILFLRYDWKLFRQDTHYLTGENIMLPAEIQAVRQNHDRTTLIVLIFILHITYLFKTSMHCDLGAACVKVVSNYEPWDFHVLCLCRICQSPYRSCEGAFVQPYSLYRHPASMSSDPPPPYPGGPSAPIMEKNGQPGNNDTALSALEWMFWGSRANLNLVFLQGVRVVVGFIVFDWVTKTLTFVHLP